MEPMLDLIIMGAAGFTLNYYILDVILTLLSWAPAAIPEKNGIPKASEVLKFIITNCEHSRRDIFRNNLEIIKTILECWKSGLVIPYNLIYEKMNDSNHESRKNVWIQLLGVVLTCDFPPYDIDNEASGQSYLSILLKNTSYKYKEVYGSASEVIALALRNILKNSENVQNHSFFKKVVQQLDVLKNKGDDKFLYCLNKVHVGCPAVADKFIPKLLSLYPKVHGSFKNYVLEILYSRVKDMNNAYQELKHIYLFEDLEKKAEITQLLSLQILEKLVPDLSCDDILQFLPGIVDIHNQPSSSSRLTLYRILFVLFEKYSVNDGAKEKEIARYAQETLLIGLADSDPAIRLTIDNFWSDEKRLPKGTKERLIALMKNMFSPVTEESFLQYSTFLLLERTSHSPDYKRTIFEHPLSQCNFQAYKIQTSARSRHMIMSPLFTESVSNSTFSSLMSMDATFDQDMKLRATQQNVQFSETQEVDEEIKKLDTYNWLTGTADTFAMQDFSSESGYGSFANTLTKSHLIANKGDLKLSGKGFPNASVASDEKKYQKSPAQMLRRRFLKDNRQNDSEAFARQELRRQDRRKELQKDQRSHRDAQVVMYRQYRIGELPDIQISNSAIIQPIQALAMHDATIAKLLLQSLLTAVCNSVKEEFPEGLEVFNEEIAICFEKILNDSYMYTPYVMSFCLESLNQLPEIRFDVEAVFNACIGSNQQSIGILLLETKISAGLNLEPAPKKKRSNSHVLPEEANYWMKLAELYRSIDVYDVANGIFSIRFGNREENRRALQHECSGQYFEAVVLYNQLYDKTGEQEQGEKDFWDKSILSCFNKLCKWDDLEESVKSRFPDINSPDMQSIWEDTYMKENYLPYLVRSKMKKLLEGKKDNFLLTFFDVARQDEEKKVYIENHFSEQLALLYICQDQFDIAKHYSSSSLNRFLKEWQNLSPLAVEMQHAHLQHLLKYVELDDFLELIRKNKFVDTSYTVNVLKMWQKRFPNSIDSVEIWDDVITNRHLFMSKLKENMSSQTEKMDLSESLQMDSGNLDNESQEEFDFNKLTLVTSVHNKLGIAENCAAQGNLSVAIKMLKSIYKVAKTLDGDMWSKYIISYCSINNKRCHFVPEDKLAIVLTSWEQLNKLVIKYGESVSQKKLHSQTFEILAKMFMKNEIDRSSITSEHKNKILEISEGKSDRTQVISTILDKSFSCLKSIIQSSDPITNQDCEIEANKKNRASAHMELANFCNRYLTNDTVHGYSLQNIPSFSEFPKVLIESLLDALKFGSREATILFPRLLQIIESYPSCLAIFKERVSKMPCWLFIGWIDQMVALLDKPEAEAVHEIVENITLAYPNAIVYAFHLSYKSYDFSKCEKGPFNKVFVEKIKRILEKQTLITDFVSALEHLSVPSIYFKDYICEIVRLINVKAAEEDIKFCFKTMCTSLLEVSEDSVSGSVPAGPVQKKFAKEMKSQVFDVCGADGSKLVQCSNIKAMSDQLQNLISVAKEMDNKANKLKEANKLKKVSPWLNEFQQWKYSSQIEIPGQYSGRSKPLPEYHVKVAGFDENILVLSSVASPRRITIRGNDEKEYKILVKSGEDLRQDARIQQLFSVMNEIYAGDVNCAKRRLGLQTYKVVPLSNRLGIIEWVDNTTVLMDFLKDGMSESERRNFFPSRGGLNVWQSKFNQWGNPSKSSNFGDVYSNIYLNKTREQCVQKYGELVNMVPRSLLLKSFLKLSSSPEAFVGLRTKFAQSHAVISLSQWIIGIGDRHLGNFLIDKSSGYEIGIDFGHAFGSATQFLAVPELLPFRLTPQYLQLMEPMRVKGIYEATMVHVLSAIRDKKDLLLSVMDIFIKEPTLDWKNQANKQLQGMGIDTQEKKDDWFPKQRITIARRKLEGYNPCHIIRKELELGHKSKPSFKKMEYVCLGDGQYNIRANMKKNELTVEEQVDCLIDLATDPQASLLIYFGWNPWI